MAIGGHTELIYTLQNAQVIMVNQSKPNNALLLFKSKPNRNGSLCGKQKHLDLLMPLGHMGLPRDTIWHISQ